MAQKNIDYLDFEQPIADLHGKIEELRNVADESEVNLGEEIAKLEEKSRHLTEKIFSKMTTWQVAQMARHPQRPYTQDRSEEHTSELQSRGHLVCRLLLEKK